MNVNGLEYYVEQHGAGAPLLLLHGFTGSCDTWLPSIELFGRKRRLILVDLPGHGRSESPVAGRHAIELVTRDLIDLLIACGAINLGAVRRTQ